MKKSKKVLSLMLAGVMALSLAGCGSSSTTTAAPSSEATSQDTKASAEETETTAVETTAEENSESSAEGKTYKIGILQLVQHSALDKTNEGFVAALKDSGINYEIDQQNASGEQSTCQTIAEKLVNDGDDLIFAIATPAAQAVTSITSEIPILISAVTDPAESGLVNSNENPGVNVSGTSDLTPVKEQIDLLQKIIPDAKTVGLLYCSAENNSVIQINMAKEALDAANIAYKEYSVSNSNELQTVVESMVGVVDVIYAPTDNMIAAGMSTVAMVANENNIPTICGESGMVEEGGLATYGIDYFQLGYMAGEQAVAILTEGADITTMPIGYLSADKCELQINEETAQILGLDLSGIQ